MDAVRQHFPESDKTHKGHGRKTPSKLRSTKLKGHKTLNQDEAFQLNRPVDVPLRPIKKAKTIFCKILDMEDKATLHYHAREE